ncbi:MAG: ABC transporter ATP-binding protein, partial [Bacteroidales bacterium]
RGEVFGFLGPNGAGKTTTIRHLMGFIYPDKGSCTIHHLDCATRSAEIQRILGYVPGEIALPDEMTGIGFLKFLAHYRGLHDFSRAEQLIQYFELDARGKLRKMSKGMKQKIAIVSAFMHDPEILILDEPTSGLDPLMQNRFVNLILEEKTKGKTILMSSHVFEEVERTCDRIGIIKQGELVAIDTVDHLKTTKQKSYTVVLENEAVAAAFAKENLNISDVVQNRVTIIIHQDIKRFIEILNRYPVIDLFTNEQSLEDLFLHFYGTK